MDKKDAFENLVQELRNENTETKLNDIAYKMKEDYNVPEGIIYSFLTRTIDGSFYQTTDIRLITLFVYVALKTYGRDYFIDKVLNEGEIKEAKQFDIKAYKDNETVKLPLTIPLVIPVNKVYSTKMNVKQLFNLLNSGVINYNFDIQREAKLEIRTEGVIKTPTINQSNVDEMKELLLNDGLKDSTLYFNAAPHTSEVGEELVYNDSEHSLTITEGTRLDVLDGFHRLLAISSAMIINPFINFEFNVVFSNFTTSEALKWQNQHSKATPWTVNRKQEIKNDLGANVVTAMIENNEEFNSRVKSSYSNTVDVSKVRISFDKLASSIRVIYKDYQGNSVKLAYHLAEYLLYIFELEDTKYKLFTSQNYIRGFLELLRFDFNDDIQLAKERVEELYEYAESKHIKLSIITSGKTYDVLKKLFKSMEKIE